jgi:hypothetical protein
MLVLRSALLLLFAVSLQPAQAQEGSAFGAKFGVTAAELHNRSSGQARWGMTGSVFATTPVGNGLDLLGEVGYHAKGSHSEFFFPLEDGNGVGRSVTDSRLDYTFLLVAPQYKGALGGGSLDLFAFAGPRVDLYLGETLTSSSEPGDVEVPGGFLPRDFNTAVLGVAAGIGLDFARLLPVPLIAELRYNGDITPAYSFSGGDERVRNRTFDFRLGLSF